MEYIIRSNIINNDIKQIGQILYIKCLRIGLDWTNVTYYRYPWPPGNRPNSFFEKYKKEPLPEEVQKELFLLSL